MDIEDTGFFNLVLSSKSRYELWQLILNTVKAKHILEVGVWKGDFAKEILERCETLEKYYMIDPWARLADWNKPFNIDTKAFEDIYQEAMGKVDFASEKVVVLRGRTKEVIDKIPDESLDFAYIDGDHTLRGITIDLIKLFPKIKKDGFIAGDDFTSNPWQHDIRFEPTLVCPYSIYFAEAMNVPITSLPFNQFIIQKKIGGSFSFADPTEKYVDISLNKPPLQSEKTSVKEIVKKVMRKVGLVGR